PSRETDPLKRGIRGREERQTIARASAAGARQAWCRAVFDERKLADRCFTGVERAGETWVPTLWCKKRYRRRQSRPRGVCRSARSRCPKAACISGFGRRAV